MFMFTVAILQRATVKPTNNLDHEKDFKFHAQPQTGAYSCFSVIKPNVIHYPRTSIQLLSGNKEPRQAVVNLDAPRRLSHVNMSPPTNKKGKLSPESEDCEKFGH